MDIETANILQAWGFPQLIQIFKGKLFTLFNSCFNRNLKIDPIINMFMMFDIEVCLCKFILTFS